MADTPRHYLGLCAIAKDETPFLREWIAYHFLIGFERIFIYDNDSAVPVRDVVPDFYDAGLVDTYTIQGKGRQLTAYNHCLRQHGPECEWMAFLDLDEFLVLTRERDARTLMADFEDYAGLAVTMSTFGSDGHLGRPPGLVMENYRRCLNDDVNVKCVVRPARVTMPLSPHHFIFADSGYAVTPDGLPAAGGHAPPCAGRVRVNHYSFRSQQDYEEKISRGDAIYTDINPRALEKFYRQTERPGEERTEILAHASRVRAIMEAGHGERYYPVDSVALRREPVAGALARMARALAAGDAGLARLVLGLTWSRGRENAAYLAMAVNVCLAAGDTAKARQAVAALLALAPTLNSYRELLAVLLAAGDREEARKMASFLLAAGRLMREKELTAEVKAMAEAHHLFTAESQ